MKTPGTKDSTYGLGLSWHDTSCGTRVYGNDGDVLAYEAYSFSTPDAGKQATIALTPDFRTYPAPTVNAFIDQAICGWPSTQTGLRPQVRQVKESLRVY